MEQRDAEAIQVVVEALRQQIGGFDGRLDEPDLQRVRGFVETGRRVPSTFGDPREASRDVEKWAEGIRQRQHRMGASTETVAVICVTIAYLETIRPGILLAGIGELRKVLTDNAIAPALLRILEAWIKGGGSS